MKNKVEGHWKDHMQESKGKRPVSFCADKAINMSDYFCGINKLKDMNLG